MNQESVIADLERRTRALGVGIATVCERAGTHPTTFSRWKRSARNPEPMGASLLTIGRLYDAIGEIEAEQVQLAPQAVRA